MTQNWPDGVDRIIIKGIRATGYHGVLPEERAAGQEFTVDVTLGIDTRHAAASDDLERTVNYADVAVQVVNLIEGEPVDLIETLAERIATTLLERARVRGVVVAVHKPHAPIPVPFEDVIVEIARWR